MVALILAGVLVAIALVHLAWAAGSRFPARSERDLVAMVVGFRGQTRMPPAAASATVALGLLALAGAVLALTGPWRDGLLGTAAAVFLARGLAAYAPAWRRLTPQQPFADLDRRLYGPLCLALGVGLFLSL